jgi:hypothetical protein
MDTAGESETESLPADSVHASSPEEKHELIERLRRVDEERANLVDAQRIDNREAAGKVSLRTKLVSIAFRSGQGGINL